MSDGFRAVGEGIMRAFMSAGGNRLTAGRTLLRGQADGRTIRQRIADQGAMAESEARRILAETEPDEPQTALFGIERIAARNCAPNEWTGALADALRAFVGEGE